MAAASPLPEAAAGAAPVGLLYDERMCAHATPDGEDHPENPERLRAIWRKLNDEGVVSRCVVLKAKEAEDKHIASVHSQDHIKLIKEISSKKYNSRRNKIAKKFNSIYFNKGSSESALLAAGSVIEVAEKVAAGELSSAIALVRPPGHHAEHDKAMGFCLFNNVAVAANYLLNERTDLGIKKILIVDWDVHHGNATQKMFYDDPRVLSFSVHRFDCGSFYPYEADGSHCFIGEEAGRGYNINVPWEHGKCGDADYIAAWDHVLLPVTEAFDPDIILVSAGFDAALGDPLGGCCVTPNGYALLLTKLLGFAQGRIVMALEGGYNLRSIANSVCACAKVLLGDKFTFNSPVKQPFESTLRVIQAVRNELNTCWPVLSNKRSEIVSMIRPSPSKVHFSTLAGVRLGVSSHTRPMLEETKVGCKRKRGNNTSVPATLEHSPACFNQCNRTVLTYRRRCQRTMKAIHRQMTPETRSKAEDDELAQAEATSTQGNQCRNASVPVTLECSLTCFNQCNPTAPTDRRRGQEAMKARHRQMTSETRSKAQDEELAQAEATSTQGKQCRDASVPGTLECSLTCFNQCNPTAPTDRRRGQEAMKAIHRQMTPEAGAPQTGDDEPAATQGFLDVVVSDSSDSDYIPSTPPVRCPNDVRARDSGTVQTGPNSIPSATAIITGPSEKLITSWKPLLQKMEEMKSHSARLLQEQQELTLKMKSLDARLKQEQQKVVENGARMFNYHFQSTSIHHPASLNISPGPVPPLQFLVPGSIPFCAPIPISSRPVVPSLSSWLSPVQTQPQPPAIPSVICTLPSVSLSFETPGSASQKGQAAVASTILAQTAPVESAQAIPPGTAVTGSLP